mgnify:CR=1 FL=1
MSYEQVLMMIAAAAFGLAAVGVTVPRLNLGWLGAAVAAVAVVVYWHV